ncbi:hypothetical protein GCM10027051_36530 [Niabella terrae]
MQTIIGRITTDAQVKTVADDREIIEFTVAQNDYYKPRNSTEARKLTNFFNCSYWMGSGLAPFLTKGTLVEVIGRLGMEVWNNKEGEARAALTLHVQHIQLLSRGTPSEETAEMEEEESDTEKEQLPF